MRKKKLLFLLSAALMLHMIPQASASKQAVTRIDALCQLPEISVKVPSSSEIFINPYKMDVTIEADETNAQIVSVPAAIENESPVPLQVTATVTGKLKEGSDMSLSTSPTNGIGTRKKAFLYFEIVAANDEDSASWAKEYDAEKHLIVRTTAKTKKNIVTLSQSGKPGSVGAFRLTGDCTATPKIPWAEKDGIDVEIAFTFKPMARQQG